MKKTERKVIFFGRLEERKGLPEFVEALNFLAGSDAPVFRVTFVGKVVRLYATTSRGMDSEAFIKSKVDSRVQYSIVGDLGSQEAIDFVKMSEGAVVCLASPSDNFPNAALEMGQLARRLVVSDTKGFHQTLGLIGRTEALYWFKPGCSISLANAIRAALEESGAEPEAPSPMEVNQLNQQLLKERLDLLHAAFNAKREQHALSPARIRAAVILSPRQAKIRDIRRSLLSLARVDREPESVVVVDPGLPDDEVRRLEDSFPGLLIRRDSGTSLQEILRPAIGAGAAGEYALIMLAGVALKKSAITNLAMAGARHPALAVAAESVLGCCPRILSFEAPSLSMLVRANNSCGSCLTISMPFFLSLPPLPVDRPALTLWLIVLAATAQGERICYLPLPQHSVRPPSAVAVLRPREPADEELSSLWHYLAGLEISKWSRRELRSLVLSVQQLAFGAASARQAEWRSQNPTTELRATKTALQTANTELHNAKTELHSSKFELENARAELANVYASSTWKITEPLRRAADWLRGSRCYL